MNVISASQPALLGGSPVRTQPFPAHNPIGPEERSAAIRVIDSGVLSQFLGAWHKDFFGGPEVLEFEKQWASFCGSSHAVSVNSATSGLVAAIAAADVGPGDEVIVTPYTMAASATCIIAYNAVPVFADIDPNTFCIDPASVASKITPRTKAIMVVDLLGHPADLDPILALARKHNLIVIEDASQAPGAVYQGKKVGSISDMTIFSLNYHKHIHTGEGGVVTTNSDELAERLQLARNHGEVVAARKPPANLSNTFGFNWRLTELQAAIGIEQLRKLPRLLQQRTENVTALQSRLSGLPGLKPVSTQPGCRQVYYVQAFSYDAAAMGMNRTRFVQAIQAELPTAEGQDWPLVSGGYVRPLYMLPMFQNLTAYGKSGCPFRCPLYQGQADYRPGLCPETEKAHHETFLGTEFMRPPATPSDMEDVARAFEKVYEHRVQLGDGFKE
jgi:perosamine synthetase